MSNQPTHAGIDYGLGKSNIDQSTGIRYGVIPSRAIDQYSLEELCDLGTDTDYEDYRKSVRDAIDEALSSALDCYIARQKSIQAIVDAAVDEAEEHLGDNYEQTGDNQRFTYEGEGIKLEHHSDGDLFITASPFYTHAQFCSPCAPGAGYLLNPCPDGPKTYCLPPSFFEGDLPPYPVYKVSNGSLVHAGKNGASETNA